MVDLFSRNENEPTVMEICGKENIARSFRRQRLGVRSERMKRDDNIFSVPFLKTLVELIDMELKGESLEMDASAM